MSSFTRILPSVALSAIIFAGCQDSPTDYEPEPTPSGEVLIGLRTNPDEARPLEAVFARISQRVKGFGGYYYDEEGSLVALLTDPAEEGMAVELLESTLEKRGIHWGGITQNGTRYAILSAMWNIERDLGALTTF